MAQSSSTAIPPSSSTSASHSSAAAAAGCGRPPVTVKGVAVTPLTQCAHWHSDLDVIAIRHRCCGEYYACISCHEALAGHPSEVWPRETFSAPAAAAAAVTATTAGDATVGGVSSKDATGGVVLCGRCRRELSIAEYLGCGNTCPGCGAGFNPGCAKHYDLYFEM
ncbi:hypothetical protein BX600DRAFT_517187 [Xylariales sp. PMI_506]|nr:hypothetical protein BX600DRAFT_517187 [Xylariales sp. PMI_506]